MWHLQPTVELIIPRHFAISHLLCCLNKTNLSKHVFFFSSYRTFFFSVFEGSQEKYFPLPVMNSFCLFYAPELGKMVWNLDKGKIIFLAQDPNSFVKKMILSNSKNSLRPCQSRHQVKKQHFKVKFWNLVL